jgi:hypothetical protein
MFYPEGFRIPKSTGISVFANFRFSHGFCWVIMKYFTSDRNKKWNSAINIFSSKMTVLCQEVIFSSITIEA